MTESERLVADYAGTGLTVGPHPMALRRDDLPCAGLTGHRLRTHGNGRRVRVPGW
jgi:error-prone DNA polymerase